MRRSTSCSRSRPLRRRRSRPTADAGVQPQGQPGRSWRPTRERPPEPPAAAHPCPATPQADQAITISGAPARLLSMQCPSGSGFLVELAVTIHDGTAFVFTSQKPVGDRQPERRPRRLPQIPGQHPVSAVTAGLASRQRQVSGCSPSGQAANLAESAWSRPSPRRPSVGSPWSRPRAGAPSWRDEDVVKGPVLVCLLVLGGLYDDGALRRGCLLLLRRGRGVT